MAAVVKNGFILLLDKSLAYISEKSLKYPHYTKSFILHFFLVLVLSGMLPKCSKDIEKPKVIAIDILPLGEAPKTTPQAQTPKPKVEQKKPEVKKPEPPKAVKKPEKATKMEKAEKPKPVAKPAIKKPAQTKVEKKPEVKEIKKADEQKKDSVDQEGQKKLLKDLEKKEQAQLDALFEETSTKPEPTQQTAQASGKSEPVVDAAFVNELMGKIQSQISQCWNIPIGAEDVQNIKVKLFIALTSTGAVTDVKIVDQLQYSTDNVYRVVADSAIWAVKECSPLQGLPADKYDVWKEIEFNFDPSLAL
jgi:outer membrane biosynthesis protein TonB